MALPYNIFKELNLKPGIPDQQVLAEAEKLYRQWMNRSSSNPHAKPKMERFREIVNAIKANPTLIAEHAALYADVIKREKMEQEKAIREQASLFVVDGEIEEKNLKDLVARNKAFTRDEILRILGAKVKAKKVFKYQDDPTVPEVMPTLYKQIVEQLAKAGKRSLYDFLNVKPNADANTINRVADKIYNENQLRPANDQKTLINNLVGHCRALLIDPAKRKSYDKTLANAGFIPVRDKLFLLSIVRPDQYKALLEECTRNGIPRDKAEFLIYQAAESKNIAIVESSANDALSTCRFCGSLNSPEAKVCKTCGMPIVIVCPKCGHKSTDPDELKCTSCGFSIGDMPEADLNVKSAETAMKLGNIDEARKQLEAARALWPGHPRIKQTEDALLRAEKTTGDALAQARNLAKARRYTAMSGYFNSMGYSPEAMTLRKEAETAIDSAAKVVAQAASTADANRRIDLYMQALSICADCKEALDKLRLTPPAPPASVKATATRTGVHIEWPKAQSGFITYDIVRKVNGRPSSITDGEPVGNTSGSMFDDTSAKPGVSYFYAVFSSCGDIKSRTGASTATPVLLTSELDARKVTYNIQATSIGLTWVLPPHAQGVEVVRDGKPLRVVNGSNFNDSGLTTEREYSYTLRAVFIDSTGGRHVTQGVSLRLKPTAPPEAVKLTVEDSAGQARLSWTTPRKGTVSIYVSDTPPGHNPNDIVNTDTIKATRLNVSGNSCTVNKDFMGERFYLAVTQEGNVGVAGNTVSVISVAQPLNVKTALGDGCVNVSWEWGNCTAVQVSVWLGGNSPRTQVINKPQTPMLKVNTPDGTSSVRIEVAGYAVTTGGRVVLSSPIEKVETLRSMRVDFTGAKSKALFGMFGRDNYQLTLRSEGALPCALNVLSGEGFPPVDLTTANVCHVIQPSDLTPGQETKIDFTYSRRNKSEKLFFRIVPADRSKQKQVRIVPDSRQV